MLLKHLLKELLAPFFLKIIVDYSTIVVELLVVLAGTHGMGDLQMILDTLGSVEMLRVANFALPVPRPPPLIGKIHQVGFLRHFVVFLLEVCHQAAEPSDLSDLSQRL